MKNSSGSIPQSGFLPVAISWKLGKKFGEKFLNAPFDFRAGNVFRIMSRSIPRSNSWTRRSSNGTSHFLESNRTSLLTFQVKKNSAPALDAFMRRAVHQIGVVSVAAFRRAWQFHFSGQHQPFFLPVKSQIRTLPLDALGFLNFAAGETPFRMLGETALPPTLQRGRKT